VVLPSREPAKNERSALPQPTGREAINATISPTRKIGDGPFCWQSKPVLRLIRDHFDQTNNVTSAIAVYVTLTEIASDMQAESFDRRIGEIAARAGVSYRTAAKILTCFEKLSIIAITRNKISGTNENAPSTYTLLMLGNGFPTFGNQSDSRSLPRSIEESLKQSSRKSHRKQRTHHSDEWRSWFSDKQLKIVDLYNGVCVPRGWRPVNTYSEELQNALEKFCDTDIENFKHMFETAADERDAGDSVYNTGLGNKLIRILWQNYQFP